MNQQPQMQPQQQEPEVTIRLKVSQVNLVIAGLEDYKDMSKQENDTLIITQKHKT